MGIHQRQMVKTCIEGFTRRTDDVGRLFFRELFHLDFSLEQVLPGHVADLNRKFQSMMATLKNVKHLEKISDSIKNMGRRHASHYAVKPEQLPLAREAMLKALRIHLKDDFNDELEAAWCQVMDDILALMVPAMEGVPESEKTRKKFNQDAYDGTLLEDVGGRDVVENVHTRFYDVMFDEPWLGRFFLAKHKEALILKQTKFMVAAFGGPNEYEGDTPAFVHMHMFVTEEQADLREKILKRAIRQEGLGEDIVERWLAVDQAFRPAIVKQSVDDCVMKCIGQFPVSAEKPLGYKADPDIMKQ